MMKPILSLFLTALLLCGCAAQNAQSTETAPVLSPVSTQPQELPPQPLPTMELLTEDDSLVQYSLPENSAGVLYLQDNLLVFSSDNTATTLLLLDPDTLDIVATHEVPFILTAENFTVQKLDSGLSYFNSAAWETVVLDSQLREIQCIQAPADLSGMPLLSADGTTLYYCTATAIRALDRSTGISRILKEAAYPVQGLSGILLDGSVLQISITDTDGNWRTLFLSSKTGQLLQESDGNILPKTGKSRYLLHHNNMILFGHTDSPTMVLQPQEASDICFFLDQYIVTAAGSLDGWSLSMYDLDSGLRMSGCSLPAGCLPHAVIPDNRGQIWCFCRHEDGGTPHLFRWDPQQTLISDSYAYTAPYYTRTEPDYEGLAACALYAQELSSKYGIEILVYKDAAALEPWDYHLDYEYQASILHRELEALDLRLGNFPEGFLAALRSRFTALKICIVRSATGTPESGSLEVVNGIQFMDGFDAYIVLAADHDTEYALYHELSHLMETVILTESVAFDRWDNLNPSDFQYDNDYLSNQTRDGSPWMKPGKEYFIDTYAMSFPKEDRARLFEYAMTSGHADLFQSPNLQAKLRQLCTGIREAFGLEQSEETFLWEQYLIQ